MPKPLITLFTAALILILFIGVAYGFLALARAWRRFCNREALITTTLEAPLTPEQVARLSEPLGPNDIWPEIKIQPGSNTASDPSPHSTQEDEARALSAASMMMSLGQMREARDALADYIQKHPQQAIGPWLKLLEVYWSAGMKKEYEALSIEINQVFNIESANWDAFSPSKRMPHTLESYPHIIEHLQHTWGTIQAQTYLHALLRDNRQGTRQGFPMLVVEEILLLQGILTSQLGPYRPTQRPDNVVRNYATRVPTDLNAPK